MAITFLSTLLVYNPSFFVNFQTLIINFKLKITKYDDDNNDEKYIVVKN